jgi:Ca2+-binding EF-hand superfamily protein
VVVEVENSDSKWRLQQLQTQYDYLVSKTTAHSAASNQLTSQIEDYQLRIKELRRSLEELRSEKELSDIKAARVENLEDTVAELRQANRSLEDKIARLCETPFISEAFGLHESKLRYEDIAKDRENLLAKVDHLQEEVRTHFSALTSLKQQASVLREEKQSSDKAAEELRLKLQELSTDQSLLQDQLRLYSGDDGVDIQDLERALTMVKRATETIDRLPFLEDPDGEKLVTLPAVRRKLEEYQVLNLKITEENQRLESMLKLQTQISRDLHKEIESLVRNRDKDKQSLLDKAGSFEELAAKRLEKIHKLEAQVRQYIYGLSKNSKVPKSKRDYYASVAPEQKGVIDPEDEEAGNALLSELIEDKGGNIREDENLLEIWVKSCSIRDGVLSPGSSTFVVIDFFDYESQTTALLSGSKPQWDFAATYKLIVDDFLLRYLATDTVTLELNMATQGDFTMLARCSIPISSLLKARPRLQLTHHPMLSVKTGQIVANISLDIRLALPVSELYRLFLERHPNEKQHIEDISAKRVVEAAANNELSRNLDGGLISLVPASAKEDESRLYNELDVIIHRCSGIPLGPNNQIPTVYVHFQLLGHPDKLTNAKNSSNPEFNEKFTFPMVTTDQQVRLLQRSSVQLSVIDMDEESIIGEVFVKLASLSEGTAIADTFNVKDVNGKTTAEMSVTLKWRHPLKLQRDLGPRALSGMELELLISAFSPGDFEEGVIDYRAFARFIEPPSQVLHAMEKLRMFCNGVTDREGRSSRDVFRAFFLSEEESRIDEDTFVQRVLKTQVDVAPSDLVKLFQFVDSSQEGSITLDKFLAVLNLDEISGIPMQLQHKLRERAKDLSSRGIRTVKLFEDADQWGANGLVTRSEFKKVLKVGMGFMLVDEPDPVHSFVGAGGRGDEEGSTAKRSKIAASSREEGEHDMLNDTFGSDDNILVQSEFQSEAAAAGIASTQGPSSVQAIMKQQREIFELKRKDIELRSQKAIMAVEQNIAATSTQLEVKPAATSRYQPQSAEEVAADPYQHRADHQVSVSSNDTNRPLELDDSTVGRYATKLQSQYRGYSARKSHPSPLKSKQQQVSEASGPNRFSNALVGVSNILTVENILNESSRSLGGHLPDLAAGFLKVDQKRTGLVTRMQFAHVVTQFPVIHLTGTDLKAAMDYFDVTGEGGSSIDYHAFLRFYSYRDPQLIPAILRLQTMTLNKNSIVRFRKSDETGSGYIKRVDMMKSLRELGQAEMPQATLSTIMHLFETRVDGQVNYANFFEYTRESDLSQKVEKLSVQLFALVTGSAQDSSDPSSVRDWFDKIAKSNTGKFTIQQFASFLKESQIDCSKEAAAALYSQLDADGRGVEYSQFTAWLSSFNRANADAESELAMFSSLSLSELQRKAFKYFAAVSSTVVGAQMLSDSFLVYDWRRSDSGAIAKPLFVRAVRRAGFPFTMNEIRTLTSEFSLMNNGEVVSYKNFLRWITPDSKTAALLMAGNDDDAFDNVYLSSHATGDGKAASVKNTGGTITRFLERCMLRGVDLMSIFGRYDTISVGRVTSSEFCSALSEMGLSSLTQRDALEFADRYRSAAGDFILYRRIVAALLKQADDVTEAANVDPIEVLRAAMQNSRVDVRRLTDVFEYYDRKGNGSVRKDDLETIMDDAKLRIRRTEIEAIGSKFSIADTPWMNYVPLVKALDQRTHQRTSLKKVGQLPDEVSIKVKSLIETLILRGVDYRSEFDRFDDQYSGSVLQADFRSVVNERFGAQFSLKELEALEKSYRSSADPRRVTFVKMIHHLHPRNFGRVSFQVNYEENDLSPGEPWEIAEMLRQKIRRRCDFLTPGELRRPFRHFARRESGDGKTVSLEDFSVAVRNLGLRLAADQEKAVFDIINLNGGKVFKYSEFVVFVNDPQHVDLVWKLRRGIARARASEKEIVAALSGQDTNGSGLITAKQFLKALRHCRVDLTDLDATRLMLRFDSEDSLRFDIDRFFRFLRGKITDGDDEDSKRLSEFDLAALSNVSSAATVVRRSSDDIETHAWNSLKRRVEEKLESGYSGNEVFAMFDRYEAGALDVASLFYGAQKLGITLTQAETRAMMRRMTILTGGTVNRASFYDALDIDLRVFSVGKKDSFGGEHGRRRGRDDGFDDSPPQLGLRPSLTSILQYVRDRLDVSVHAKDRHDLAGVVRRSLKEFGNNKVGFVNHNELKR